MNQPTNQEILQFAIQFAATHVQATADRFGVSADEARALLERARLHQVDEAALESSEARAIDCMNAANEENHRLRELLAAAGDMYDYMSSPPPPLKFSGTSNWAAMLRIVIADDSLSNREGCEGCTEREAAKYHVLIGRVCDACYADCLAHEWVQGTGVNVDAPDWEDAGEVHDWRNYVPANVKSYWDYLPKLGKAAVFLMAKELADNEDWD